MRLASLAVLALFSSVALVGCGDDGGGGIEIADDTATTTEAEQGSDGGESAGDTDALIDYLADSEANIIDTAEAECVAEAANDLSADGYDVVAEGDDLDLSDFSDDDADVLAAAFDECIDFDDLVTKFGEQMTSQAELPLTEDEAQCAAAGFAEAYEGAGEFIREVSSLSDDEAGVQIFEALGPCITDESAVAFMASIMSGQGQDDTTSQCVAEAVVGQLGAEAMLDGFAEAGVSGSSPELEGAITEAITVCGDAGGFGGDVPVDTIPGIGGGLSGN